MKVLTGRFFRIVQTCQTRQNICMLNQIILSFVQSLPDTIRKDICAILIAYSGHVDDYPMLPDEVENSAWEFLSPGKVADQISVIYVCSAILDRMLEHFSSPASSANIEELKMFADKTGNAMAMKVVAGHALRKKHFQQAYDTWVSLRTEALSPEAIFGFVEEI